MSLVKKKNKSVC